ncbi:hypothetical protein [Hahella ganghwensis]|uniref:hypothetical protein n=1 Tax=Hahella ganghwensis TaxID=286420 RepID=UPI00035C8A90|nr:hypothetical protein [Hahella ganghwensis]
MAISGNPNPEEYYTPQNFVELVDPLNKTTGKKIYVSKNQLERYKNIFNGRDKDFNFSYLYKQITSLKNVGFMNSLLSRKSVLARMLPLEGGQLVYVVWKGEVYIEEIKIQADYKVEKNKRTVAAGVYKATQREENRWAVGESAFSAPSLNVVNTKNLAINGHCEDINDAATYMPKFIRHGFGESALNGVYALFFNPCQGFANGDWQAIRDSSGISSTQASKKLAEVLAITAKKNMEVNLTVHESGHALLKEALRQVHKSSITLDQFTVFYANPTHNIELVDVWRRRTGMRLSPKPPLMNSYSPHQFLLTGNAISYAPVAYMANNKNAVSTVYNSTNSVLGAIGLKAVAGSLGLAGAASWAFAAAPYLLGTGRSANQEVIETPGQAVEHGTKLVWNSMHKMMVKG